MVKVVTSVEVAQVVVIIVPLLKEVTEVVVMVVLLVVLVVKMAQLQQVAEEVLEVLFIELLIHSHQQINPLVSPTQWVLVEKELEWQRMVKGMMVVETKVVILPLQSLGEL